MRTTDRFEGYRYLLVLDLETTGLWVTDHKDDIIEIGCLLADVETMSEIDSFTMTLAPSLDAYLRMVENSRVRKMHEANGLFDEVCSLMNEYRLEGTYVKLMEQRVIDAEMGVIEMLNRNGVGLDEAIIAGSGVARFDVPALLDRMPVLADYVSHRSALDIGYVRRFFENFAPGIVPTSVNDDKTHRAIDDCRCHLEEIKAYRDLIAGL